MHSFFLCYPSSELNSTVTFILTQSANFLEFIHVIYMYWCDIKEIETLIEAFIDITIVIRLSSFFYKREIHLLV